MMDFFAFVRACIRTAFWHRRSWLDLVALVCGLAFPFVFSLLLGPEARAVEGAMRGLYVQTPICGLAAVVLARLIVSPYWICQKHRDAATAAKKQLRQYLYKKEQSADALEQKKFISDMLASYLKLIEEFIQRIHAMEDAQFDDVTVQDEAMQWDKLRAVIDDFLRKHVSEYDASAFENKGGMAETPIVDVAAGCAEGQKRRQLMLDVLNHHFRQLQQITDRQV